jgi:tryptophanase
MKTIIEPFRIKMVEPIRILSKEERAAAMKRAGYNLFHLRAEEVTIDLLTDSGTGAMSAKQWAGILEGDESYAGARSFFRFEKTFRELTGFKHIIPTHQGRASEKILFTVMVKEGEVVPSNTHFDTTRANVEYRKAEARDFVVDEAKDFRCNHPFKGNMHVGKLRHFLETTDRSKVPLVMLTVTNNSWGGQPVSLANIREVSEICGQYKIPFILDACRFAENAYFIKLREPGQSKRSIREIAEEMFSYADGCTFSAK